MPDTAIFDVDGTLVDTNDQHALAWFRAFRRFDITLPLWQLYRGIGMTHWSACHHMGMQPLECGDIVRTHLSTRTAAPGPALEEAPS